METRFMKRTLRLPALLPILIVMSIVSVVVKSSAMPLVSPELEKASPVHDEAIQFLKNNAFDKAVRLENEILQDNPEDVQAYLILTLAYLGKGDETKALEQAERVHKVDPKFEAEIYKSIGNFYSLKKRYYKALVYLHKVLDIKEDPDVIQQIASIYLLQERIQKAKTYYEKLLNSKPDYMNLSRIYLAERDYKNAIFYADKAIGQDEKAVGAYVILGSSYLLNDDLELSKSTFLTLKKLAPTFFLASHYLGLIHLIQEQYDDALQEFGDVLRISPKVKEAHLNMAVVWHLKGNLEQAQEEALKAIESDPLDFLGHLALGNIYLSENDYKKADQAYQKAGNLFPEFTLPQFTTSEYFKPEASHEPAYFTLSNIYFREGLFQRTIETVDTALKTVSSENPFLFLVKARAEAKLGNLKKAEDLYSYVMKSTPEIITPYIELGDLAAYQDDINQAVAFYEKALEFAPDLPKLHLGLGDFYNKLGQVEKAIREYKKVISLSPESVIGYNQLAWTLAEKREEFDEALSYALKGSALDPKNINMQDTLGWIYYRLGKYNEAIELYSDIVESGTNNPFIYYHLGLVYHKKTSESFENALNISDEFPEAEKTKEYLKVLSGF